MNRIKIVDASLKPIFRYAVITNEAIKPFLGTKKYYSTGTFTSGEYELVSYDKKPSRANLQLRNGQLSLAKMKDTEKVTIVTEEMENNIYSTGFFALEPRNINKKYLFYILHSPEFIQEKNSLSFGTTQFSINEDRFKKIKVNVILDKTKQLLISDFLDSKINIIDKLIANQEKQIEKLIEYKQSIITEVVTKGLDPKVEMKDSGVEWIGEIPEKWSTIKIKFTSWLKGRIGWDGLKSTEFIDDGPYLITGTDFVNGEINWNTCVHISEERYAEDELLHIKEDDLLITKDGTIGKLAIAKNCPKKVSLNSGVMIIRSLDAFNYSDKYLYYILKSNQFYVWYELSQSGNSTIKHLYQGQFYNFEFSFPDINEQNKITNYLDKKCSEISSLINIKNQKIEKLQEYKKSLIYEYVTGKKQVA